MEDTVSVSAALKAGAKYIGSLDPASINVDGVNLFADLFKLVQKWTTPSGNASNAPAPGPSTTPISRSNTTSNPAPGGSVTSRSISQRASQGHVTINIVNVTAPVPSATVRRPSNPSTRQNVFNYSNIQHVHNYTIDQNVYLPHRQPGPFNTASQHRHHFSGDPYATHQGPQYRSWGNQHRAGPQH